MNRYATWIYLKLYFSLVAIDIGHGVPCDGGAYGIRREDDLNREVGDVNGYDSQAVAETIFRGICRAFDVNSGYSSNNDGAVGNGGASPVEEYYTVLDGDTLWGISQKYGNSVDWLAQVNGIENRDLIFVGQVIRVR